MGTQFQRLTASRPGVQKPCRLTRQGTWKLTMSFPRPGCDHCPAVGSAPGTSWDLTLTLTLPRTGTLPRNLSLPRSLILHLSCLLAWALTSDLEGNHKTGVASALATSLDRTLTLAKALSPWGPNYTI